jgi:hypothetical protein
MVRVSLSLREEMDLIGKELHHHFSPTQLEVLARQSGFVQRKSKLTAQDFVSLCTFLDHDLYTQSLASLCSQLDAARKVSISAEGLNQRFHESGVTFLRTLFTSLLPTNIPKEHVDKEHIYPFYSLRWQVEILFKSWKSFFHIDWIKAVKIDRFECHLYGKLIALLLTSSLMFQMREILLRKKKREVSELKAMAILKTYLGALHGALNGHIEDIVHVLQQILQMIEKNGRKSHWYKKKTVFDILGVAYDCARKSRAAA